MCVKADKHVILHKQAVHLIGCLVCLFYSKEARNNMCTCVYILTCKGKWPYTLRFMDIY